MRDNIRGALEGLASILGGFDPQYRKQEEQKSALASLAQVATGQNIPAYRRAELGNPNAINQEIQRNLSAGMIVNPETAGTALSALLDTPERQIARQELGLRQQNLAIEQQKAARAAQQQKLIQDLILGGGGAMQPAPTAQPTQNMSMAPWAQQTAASVAAPTAGQPDPNKLAMVGALTGDPQVMQYANFLQQQKSKQEDRDYEANVKPLSGEAATRLSLVKEGQRAVSSVKELVRDKDGSLDHFTIAQIQDIPLTGAITLTPKARKLWTQAYTMANAKLRLETGAAAPEAEVRRTAKALLPSLLDSSSVIDEKLSVPEQFFSDYGALTGNRQTPLVNKVGDRDITKIPDEELLNLMVVK